MKRVITALLIAAMILCLCACEGKEGVEEREGGTSNIGLEKSEAEALSAETECSGGEMVQIPEGIRRAMDAETCLTTGTYFLMEDGSVVTRGESFGSFAGDFAALTNVRKIADSSSEMQLFALTNEGDLYFHRTKILSNVTDIVYSTTNMNQAAVCISNGKLYRVNVRDTGDVNATLRESSPDTYIDVGTKTVNYYELLMVFSNLDKEKPIRADGELVRLSAEKSDFFVLNSDGQVFMDNNGGLSEEYVGLECFTWNDLVLIDAAKVMLSAAKDPERECELTVAGIQSDGTVLACGAYADEILSWGELNYLTMDDTLIVGLTSAGTLKVAGPVAEYVEKDLADWTNIVGVKVGNVTGTTVLNAVDQDGNYYHLEYDERWLENIVATFSLANGCSDSTGNFWYLYRPDGTVLCSSGENGSWQ